MINLVKYKNIRIKSVFLIVLCFEIMGSPLYAQSLNGKSLNTQNLITDHYSFFVSGHFHGSSNNKTGKPAKTILNNIEKINNEQVLFIASLGDIFMDVKNDIPAYNKLLLDRLAVPVFNAPGNHDKSGSVYENNYGITYYNFKISSELFVFLDTEMNDGNITDDQYNFLKSSLDDTKGIKNIFIFTHRLIWAEDHPDMLNLFKGNTRSERGNNFRNEILPLLTKCNKNISIYLFGGSMSAAPSSFFYHKEGRIYYIATAIRDTPKDAMLKVDVKNSKVSFSAFPLVLPIEMYNIDYYLHNSENVQRFNWRLVPLYIKTMLSHRYFWYGILMIMIPFISIWGYRKLRKKN
jgi:calcineurin-like phosphoesterase family protein